MSRRTRTDYSGSVAALEEHQPDPAQAAVKHGVYAASGYLACRKCPLRPVGDEPARCEEYDHAGDCQLEHE